MMFHLVKVLGENLPIWPFLNNDTKDTVIILIFCPL
jgi:hypothetical protein